MDQQPYQQYQQYQQPPQSQAQTKGQLAVARARNAQDNVVLTITIIVFCFFAASYFIYTTFQEMSTDNAGHPVDVRHRMRCSDLRRVLSRPAVDRKSVV